MENVHTDNEPFHRPSVFVCVQGKVSERRGKRNWPSANRGSSRFVVKTKGTSVWTLESMSCDGSAHSTGFEITT
jgi:hypothetical protein